MVKSFTAPFLVCLSRSVLTLQSGPLGETNAREPKMRAPAACRRGALHNGRRPKVCASNAFRRWHLGISVGATAPARASPQLPVGGSSAIPGAAKRTAAGAASGALRRFAPPPMVHLV